MNNNGNNEIKPHQCEKNGLSFGKESYRFNELEKSRCHKREKKISSLASQTSDLKFTADNYPFGIWKTKLEKRLWHTQSTTPYFLHFKTKIRFVNIIITKLSHRE